LDKVVEKYFRAIESKDHVPDSEWEFGYFGRHYVLVIPSDVIEDNWDKALVPKFFELQIKTLFQHAWSEAEHDLGYKEVVAESLNLDQKRRLAFTSAQAWGADHMFDELFRELTTPIPSGG
jgi:putative GTP pyrophosphokinase